jgi:hypothetical protein
MSESTIVNIHAAKTHLSRLVDEVGSVSRAVRAAGW